MTFYYKIDNGLLTSSIPLKYKELTKDEYEHLLEVQTLLKEINLEEVLHLNTLF